MDGLILNNPLSPPLPDTETSTCNGGRVNPCSANEEVACKTSSHSIRAG
jgi:hypothetical protein